MPFDAQGNFTRVMNWQDDAANDIAILASRHDAEDDNFADGFNNTVCRDGRATMTGALKMGSNKITGVANGTAANDAVNRSQLVSAQSTLQTQINSKANDNAVVKLTGAQTVAGTKTFSSSPVLPTPSSSDSSTKGATTAFIKNVLSTSGNGLATFSKAQNGYYKFSNGLIVQWGKCTTTGNTVQVTMPTSFTETKYSVIITSIGEQSVYQRIIKSIDSTSKFTTYTSGGAASLQFFWVAIGY